MISNKWISTVVEDDDGNLALVLPEKLIEALQWTEEDELQWIDNGNGTWSLQRKNNE